jgi:hypothetical protein
MTIPSSIHIPSARQGGFSAVSLPGPLSVGDRDPFYEFTPQKSGDTWRLTEKEGFARMYDMTYVRSGNNFSVSLATDGGLAYANFAQSSVGFGQQFLSAENTDFGVDPSSDGFTLEALIRSPAGGADGWIPFAFVWQSEPQANSAVLVVSISKDGGSRYIRFQRNLTVNEVNPPGGELGPDRLVDANAPLGDWHHVRYTCDFAQNLEGYALNGTPVGGSDSPGIDVEAFRQQFASVNTFKLIHAWTATPVGPLHVRLARLWHRPLPLSGFTPPS